MHRNKANPYIHFPGYIASRKNPFTDGYLVLYHAYEAGIDDAGGPWVCVCETHHTVSNFKSQKLAKLHLPTADWCEDCMLIKDRG